MKWIHCFFLFSGTLFGYFHPCPGQWAVTGEYLYLMPSIDDTYYVIDVDNIGAITGPRINNDFDFDPGYRVAFGYGFCNCQWEFRIDYTRLRSHQAKTISGELLYGSIGTPALLTSFSGFTGTATSQLQAHYQRLEAILTRKFWSCCGLDLFFHWGLEYAFLNFSEDLTFVQFTPLIVGEVDLDSRTWGLGPQFGLEFDYKICNLFSCGKLLLVASGSGSVIALKSKSLQQDAVNGVIQYDVPDDHAWRLTSVFHSRVGLSYVTNFPCITTALEVGYEFHNYLRSYMRSEYPSIANPGRAISHYLDYDLQGLYVSGTLAY